MSKIVGDEMSVSEGKEKLEKQHDQAVSYGYNIKLDYFSIVDINKLYFATT